MKGNALSYNGDKKQIRQMSLGSSTYSYVVHYNEGLRSQLKLPQEAGLPNLHYGYFQLGAASLPKVLKHEGATVLPDYTLVRTSGGLKLCCLSLLFLLDQRCQTAHPREFYSRLHSGALCVKSYASLIKSSIMMSDQVGLGMEVLVSKKSCLVFLPVQLGQF